MHFEKQDGKKTRGKIKDSEPSATLSLCSADSCCNWCNSINIYLSAYAECNIHTLTSPLADQSKHWQTLCKNAAIFSLPNLGLPAKKTLNHEVWKVSWHMDPFNTQSCQRFFYPGLWQNVLTGRYAVMARRGSTNPSAFILRAPSPVEMLCWFAFV